jgi:hypothetical protein
MNVISDPRRVQASRIKPDPVDPRGRAYKVVDTDFHVLPEWSDLRNYLKEPFRSELTSFPLAGGDYTPKYAIGLEGTGQETQGRARNAADILRVIDEIGVETVIITPGFTRPQSMFHSSMVTATAAAFNDFLINEVLPASPRIKAEIMINHRDPAAGAAEIRRLGAHPGFVGVYTEFGGNSGQKFLAKLPSEYFDSNIRFSGRGPQENPRRECQGLDQAAAAIMRGFSAAGYVSEQPCEDSVF